MLRTEKSIFGDNIKMLPLLRPESTWFVYMLLHIKSTIPYIGKTNNLTRRLRQHNGEISGGAKTTHRALNKNNENDFKWRRVLHVKGFIDERAALHFENRFQRERRKASASASIQNTKNPLWKGLQALKAVMECTRPTRAARPLKEYGVEIVFENEEAESLYTGVKCIEKVKDKE